MVRPQYANSIAITYNPKLKEVVINFSQDYPMFAASEQKGQDGPVEMQTLGAREDVCGIVLTEDMARELCNILAKSLPSE